MSFNHVIVWLDHAEAHLIRFNPEVAQNEVIKSPSTQPHLHIKSGLHGLQHGGRTPESAAYLNEIAIALKEPLEILIVGPGVEKLVLVKHLMKHQHDVAEKIVGVETVDHPTDGQLLAYARKYFVKADRLR